MTMRAGSETVTIVGAGLCGSLLAIVLQRRGFDVSVLERRADPRCAATPAGRSINLALSARGIRALRHANAFSRVEHLLMPMRGRIVHSEDGTSELQPYGQREHERIYSVSRAELNRILIDTAECDHGIGIAFEQEVTAFDNGSKTLHIAASARDGTSVRHGVPVIAADGAGSAIRRAAGNAAPFFPREDLLPHGYKELSIPAAADGSHRLDPGGLHIWPRGGFMLIALPNPGGDFTLTLFLPNEGRESFATLNTIADIERFFERYFGDVAQLIPDVSGSFLHNPTGILGTVRCRHWHHAGNILLIGDAAHAIVPFHGQGMNLAFEDCVLLDRVLGEATTWDDAFATFEARQLPNADAIAEMALENYVEMRDTVRDACFKLRKQLSFELERRLPAQFIPRYSMIMFHDEIPYSIAQQRGALQQALLDELIQGAHSLADIDLDAAENTVRETLPSL